MLTFASSNSVEKESELASILLSLSSDALEAVQPQKKRKVQDQNTSNSNRLPSLGSLITKSDSNCKYCYDMNQYCMFCNPKNWRSCFYLIQSNLPHLAKDFVPGSFLETHGRKFVTEKGLMSHTQGSLDLPPNFYEEYLNSVKEAIKSADFQYPSKKGLQIVTDQVRVKQESTPVSPVYTNSHLHQRKRPSLHSAESPTFVKVLPSPYDKEPQVQDPNPRSQPLRWENDLYTPRWVRYVGSKKEGLCDLCEPNRWLQLKDSAFWYHKQFFHGISSSSGLVFASPNSYRSVWSTVACNEPGISVNLMTEGKCHHCQQWIPLFKNKKRFAHYFPSLEKVKEVFLEQSADQSEQGKIISEVPLVIVAARNKDGAIYVPPTVSISNAIIQDIALHESGKMSGVWWRHAHKCHSNTPNR
jgi:hypothetical protein